MLGVILTPTGEKLDEVQGEIWVFGYGSLTWNPDFPYEEQHIGFIQGFARRFWQGSTWHRGNNNKPGRVVTLVKEKESQVWGIAFKVARNHINQALGNLNQREVKLGGYEIHHKSFYPSNRISTLPTVIPVLVYVATPNNSMFVGHESPETIASHISTAHGISGPNMEYLFRLVDFMREHAPHVDDKHLFYIDRLVRRKLELPVDKVLPWSEIKSRTSRVNVSVVV